MGVTHNLYCEDCREALWCGQKEYFYTGCPRVLYAAGMFIEKHLGHTLRFASEFHDEDIMALHEDDILGEGQAWVPKNWPKGLEPPAPKMVQCPSCSALHQEGMHECPESTEQC